MGAAWRLTAAQRDLLLQARRAVLCTIAPDGTPRPVPVCFALVEPAVEGARTAPRLYTPLDDKPKRVADPHRLARVRDIVARPSVTLLVDRWDEDWDRLAWVRLHGMASLLEPGAGQGTEHAAAVAALRERYIQYRSHTLTERPIIRIDLTVAHSWSGMDRMTRTARPHSA